RSRQRRACDPGRRRTFRRISARSGPRGPQVSELVSNVVLGRVLDDTYAPEVRRDLTAFAAARMTSNACYRFVAPFIATIARGLHVSLTDIGLAIAISELSGLGSPLIGRFVDRLGARRAVATGMAACFVGTCLAAATRGVPMLAAALVILGLGNSTFYLGV